MKSFGFLSLFLCLAGIFSGCMKYHGAVRTESPQAQRRMPYDELVKESVRSVRLYKEFSTLGTFDAVWLSNDVRKTFAQIYASRRGKDTAAQQALERRQLEENNHWVSFYVLAQTHDPLDSMLNDKDPFWALSLETHDGRSASPISVKEVTLDPEYVYLFGHRYTPGKTAYKVQFPARDEAGKLYAPDGGQCALVISSPGYSGRMYWGMSDGWRPRTDTTPSYVRLPLGSNQFETEKKRDEDLYWS